MAICEVCGNEYDRPFQVWRNGRLMKFDRVDCAIQVMRPAAAVCGACGTHEMGRGIEVDGEMFCSLGCADQQKQTQRSSLYAKS